MTLETSLLLFKFILAAGLTVWMVVVAINNLTAFKGGVASLGMTMSMQLFEQAPAIDSPLLSRRVTATFWHRLVYTTVVIMECAVAILLFCGAASLLGAVPGWVDVGDAIIRMNVGLSALLAMSFVLLLGGAWFAYYIRQDLLQITHFVLIAVTIVAALFMNIPTA